MRWLPLVLLVGCVAEAGDGDLDDGAEYASEMTATEAARVLALVNYPGADQATLDDAAGLTASAAKSIAMYRAGIDGVFPSKDDNEIDGIPELDAIPNVGAAALQKLSAYASAHPAPQPVVVGSRRFLGWQAEAILWVTNTSAVGVFNGLLDNRAAANLVAARPFASLAEVDAVAFVGPSAFDVFKGQSWTWWRAFANRPAPPPPLAGTYDGISFDEVTAIEALAIANIRTRDVMVANGVAGNGASVIVGNRPYTHLSQVAAVSGVGTATMRGLHAFAAQQVSDGFVSGLFASTADAAIPDNNTALTQSLEVSGLASVPEHVMITLDIDHSRKADLRITLTQPSSAESIVWNAGSTGAPLVVPATLETDSQVNGTWLLTVHDTASGSAGVVRGWSLAITSRYD